MFAIKPVDDPYYHVYVKAGQRVEARRLEMKLSKRRLAKLAGIDIKSVRAIISGESTSNNCSVELNVRAAIRLSVVLDTTPQWLLFGIGQV